MLRTRAAVLLCVFLTASLAEGQTPTVPPKVTPAQQPISPPLSGFGLEDGTPVKVRLTRNLSSGTDKKGDQVDFEVLEDIKVADVIVIPRGSVALATITDAEPKRRMGRGGKLDVNIDSVRLKDGERAALRASKDTKGGGHVGAMTGAIVATAIVFFPAAPFFLFMHGKDINIPKGTEITAYVEGNVPLDKSRFDGQAGTAGGVATSAAAASTTTLVAISSNPSGADIEIDGNFIGTTPSSNTVLAGEHQIKITKKGFKAWERKLKTSPGVANLSADLEAQP